MNSFQQFKTKPCFFQLGKPSILPEDAPRIFFEPEMFDQKLFFMHNLAKPCEEAAKELRQSRKRACPSTPPAVENKSHLTTPLDSRYLT